MKVWEFCQSSSKGFGGSMLFSYKMLYFYIGFFILKTKNMKYIQSTLSDSLLKAVLMKVFPMKTLQIKTL